MPVFADDEGYIAGLDHVVGAGNMGVAPALNGGQNPF